MVGSKRLKDLSKKKRPHSISIEDNIYEDFETYTAMNGEPSSSSVLRKFMIDYNRKSAENIKKESK